MKPISFLYVLMIVLSCKNEKTTIIIHEDDHNKSIEPSFQNILNTSNVEGAILVYDMNKDHYYSNDYGWAEKGHLPASTFKITNTIIALETEVVSDGQTMLKWDGNPRNMDIWEQDLTLKDAFHYSCVPCYQEIARKIGESDMNDYIEKMDYGDMIFDQITLDLFWLVGESKISQFGQIDFLERFYRSELPVSERTERIMKEIMVIENNDEYRLSGKTGWSIRNGDNNGWFVGYLELTDEVYFYAINIVPNSDFDMDHFSTIRSAVAILAFEALGKI